MAPLNETNKQLIAVTWSIITTEIIMALLNENEQPVDNRDMIDNYYREMSGPFDETKQVVDYGDMIDNYCSDMYIPFEWN